MKILLTGASGKVGTQLISQLSPSYEIVALDRTQSNNISPAKFIQVDLLNPENVEAIIQKELPDIIIHLAAILGPACENDPRLAFKINVEAAVNLANIAAKYKVKKFIFASTSAVYKQDANSPTGENENISPSSVYGKTKLEAEERLEKILAESQTKLVILRMFNIYGAEFSESLIYKLLHSTEDAPINISGPENFIRDYIHISDIAKAFELAIRTDLDQQFEIFNIASGIATSNADLITTLKSQGKTIFFNLVPTPTNISWANIDKASKLLNYNPNKEILTD